jgi:hypothetical protein
LNNPCQQIDHIAARLQGVIFKIEERHKREKLSKSISSYIESRIDPFKKGKQTNKNPFPSFSKSNQKGH